jgi:hypothetical protein
MARKQEIEKAFLAHLIEQERNGTLVLNFKIRKDNNHKQRHHR